MSAKKGSDGIRIGTGLFPHEEIIIYPPAEEEVPDGAKIPPPKIQQKKANSRPKTRRKH